MDGVFQIKSRYPGTQEAVHAFERATAEVYVQSGYSSILAFEVRDRAGKFVGRFEGYVSLIDDATPEQFVKAIKER